MSRKLKVGIVGPCAAGKSTLITRLRALGFDARHIAQEHSYVPDMWQRLSQPDLLIYLDVSYPATLQRRALAWKIEEYQEQLRRLRHARQHAHFYLQTDDLTIPEVLENVLAFLNTAAGNLGPGPAAE